MGELSDDLRVFVADLARLSPADLTLNGPLFETGVIDSLNLVELVVFVEERCHIKVGAGDLTLDNWNTLEAIESYVARRTRP